MELIFRYIDPDLATALCVMVILFACAFLIYWMRDPNPFPMHVAARVWCPHQKRKFTVEVNANGALCYCSAFDSQELACDQACMRERVKLGGTASPPTKEAAA